MISRSLKHEDGGVTGRRGALSSDAPPLWVRDLSVRFDGRDGGVMAINDLTLIVGAGQMVAVVGESGSGKTTLTKAVVGLLGSRHVRGSVEIGGTEVIGAGRRQLQALRQSEVATILQDPVGSLNPVRTIGSQLYESARVAGATTRLECRRAVEDVLADVALDQAAVSTRFPHELSGGMNQRVAIAMALLKRPKLLIADESTSALDVRTQASVVALLRNISTDHGAAVLLITHDLGLALQACDHVAVMYAGRLVEIGVARDMARNAQHPYTKALLAATPRFEGKDQHVAAIPGGFQVSRPGDPGCPFRNRCPVIQDECGEAFPELAHNRYSDVWCWNVSDHD